MRKLRLLSGLFVILLVAAGAAAAQQYWNIVFTGCQYTRYQYEIRNHTNQDLTGFWRSGGETGDVQVTPGETQSVTTAARRFEVFSNQGHAQIVASKPCNPQDQTGESDPHAPVYIYLIAALDVNGPAQWICGGNPVIDRSGQRVTTPGEVLTWHGEAIPVTVLVLSDYIPPEKCAVAGAAPAWYVDYRRYTCLAFQGADRNCPGEAHYH